MFAKIISNILIGLVSVAAIVLMLKFVFGAALGNGFIVFLVAFLTAIVSVTLGILISAIVKDLPSSIQFAFYTFFLLVLTSEFFFASENIHPYFAYVTKLSPLTYSVAALRKVNLFNWGFAEVWRELAALVSFAAVYTTAAVILLNRESR
jgi:ABC-2 type transport system permease protein